MSAPVCRLGLCLGADGDLYHCKALTVAVKQCATFISMAVRRSKPSAPVQVPRSLSFHRSPITAAAEWTSVTARFPWCRLGLGTPRAHGGDPRCASRPSRRVLFFYAISFCDETFALLYVEELGEMASTAENGRPPKHKSRSSGDFPSPRPWPSPSLTPHALPQEDYPLFYFRLGCVS